eukprot:TRINITY_DN474_c0_g1_i1.p1 TRINITY_DN474_c0_g1~~TRINITY_DN474_c0_g1_i1.p1  ORF type:complete len:345 (+),score=93.51 TRINITY_DN474_c0_g1_i1:70-1104(+)
MKEFFLLVSLCVLFSLVSSQTFDPCAQQSRLPDARFDAIVSLVKAASFEDDRFKILTRETANQTLGFDGNQMLKLSQLFSFSTSKTQMFSKYQKYWLGMTCNQVVKILGDIGFDSDRLTVLPNLVNLTYDLKEKNQSIVDYFGFSSSKDAARQIIASAAPFSCVWGVVTAKTLVFIVDVSGSMSTQFKLNGTNRVISRLQYVVSSLNLVISQILKPYQNFNVIAFSGSVRNWQKSTVAVNPQNIASAVSFVSSLSASGSTNMLAAFKTAFVQQDLNAVYLLSDGSPDNGQPAPILAAAKAWSSAQPGRFINTISFQVGGQIDTAAIAFMNSLAVNNGGVARSMK